MLWCFGVGFETAYEILGCAEEELEKALKTNDIFLYRSAADKAFLALVVAVNTFIASVKGFAPRSHSERRRLLRELGYEDIRAVYSDAMKTLHEEAFYEGVYSPDEVKYAFEKVKQVIKRLEELSKKR